MGVIFLYPQASVPSEQERGPVELPLTLQTRLVMSDH